MRYLVGILLLLFVSCGEEKVTEKAPENLLEKEKMVQVLADVHLLEASLNLRSPSVIRPMKIIPNPNLEPLPPEPVDSKSPLPYYDIFKKHGVTRAQYEETMKWYSAHPEELNLLYDEVIVELTKRQASEQMKKK
jgi:hypothetical protein